MKKSETQSSLRPKGGKPKNLGRNKKSRGGRYNNGLEKKRKKLLIKNT